MSEAQAEIAALQHQLDAMRKDLADRQHTEKLRQATLVVLHLLWHLVNSQVTFFVCPSTFIGKCSSENAGLE